MRPRLLHRGNVLVAILGGRGDVPALLEGLAGSRPKTSSPLTLCWREMDSNFWYLVGRDVNTPAARSIERYAANAAALGQQLLLRALSGKPPAESEGFGVG